MNCSFWFHLKCDFLFQGFTWESLWGNAGGYIGFFLGISMLQLPNIFLTMSKCWDFGNLGKIKWIIWRFCLIYHLPFLVKKNHLGEFPIGSFLKIKDSNKSSGTFLVLVRGILFLYHLKAYVYSFILSHGSKFLGAPFMA